MMHPFLTQPALSKLLDAVPVVQRYRTLFALFDWTALQPSCLGCWPRTPSLSSQCLCQSPVDRIGEHLIPIRTLKDNIEMREAS